MDLIVPQLSSTMESARVVRWLKRPGDKVRMGEALLEVETDKATMEVESPADGILTEILVAEGEEAALSAVLGRLSTSGDARPPAAAAAHATAPMTAPGAASPAPSRSAASGESGQGNTQRAEARRAEAARAEPNRGAPNRGAPNERIKASPLARRLAKESGLDLRTIRGSGPGSRIRKRDLASEGATGGAASSTRPLSSMRARIAETVSASRKSIPSYSLDRWVETAHLTARQAEIAAAGGGSKITFTDMLLQALADVLAQMPAMSDRWVEGSVQPSVTSARTVDIGLVVAVEQGLMIPTLGDIGNRTLAHIAAARAQAVERACTGRLTASDSAPAPISLSNLGKSGVDRFEAIINPGQSSILAVGREHERAVASGGRLYAARGVNLTLSVDHRLIDGRLGAEFLGRLAERIERGSWRGR